jgi:hypothetical protein
MRVLGAMIASWGAALAGIAVLACSSGGGSASSASGFGQQYCSLIQPCCAKAGLSGNASTCEQLISAVTASSNYNAAAGQACINGLQGESSAGTLCTDLGNDVGACGQVFAGNGGGTVAPGGTCSKSTDCASGSGGSATCYTATVFLDGGGTTNSATCIQTQVGKVGDSPCIGTKNGDITFFSWPNGTPPAMAYVCDETQGSTCDSTTKTCAALGTNGQPCTGDMACTMSDYCAYAAGTSGATCQPRFADGASCASASTGCMTGSYCDASTQKCIAGLPDGTACTTSESCQSGSCVNGKCSGSSNFGLALFCGQ